MYRTLILACACVILVGSGVVHGLWTDRWSEQTDLGGAAARLDQLPTTIGAWHGTNVEMEKDPNTGLAGMIARRYVNAASGKVVTILLGCGRSGPVCTHTPDVCYAGSGYEVEKPRRFHLPSKTADAAPEFWTARFVKERATGKTHLRIFWSWHGAENWKVADNPRLSFAGEKMLYKLYLIREMVQPDEPIEGDACVEFMQELLPAFERTILTEAK
jgi:hypothetical protein